MSDQQISLIMLTCSAFGFGLLWGWQLGRKFEQQRRIAAALRARLSWHRLHRGLSRVLRRDRVVG